MDEMATARLIAVLAGCVAGLILGAVAAGIVLIAGFYRDQARRSRRWPSTLGTITASAPPLAPDAVYPEVTYSYEVAGHTYTSGRIAFGSPSPNPAGTGDPATSRYGPGRAVTVYYDPANPADAVLERRDASPLLWIIAAIVFVLAAVFPILFVLAGLAAMNG